MAVNDMLRWKASLADLATMDIKPSTSNIATAVEALVQNIYWPADSAIELYRVDGTDIIKIRPATGETLDSGSLEHLGFNVDETQFLQVKNVSGAAIVVMADGRQTR